MSRDYEVARSLIRYENEMINHRMNWFLILQGFMFAGLAFAWDKNKALCVVFSLVGGLSSVSVGLLLRYGILAIRNLERSAQNDGKVIGRGSDETCSLAHFLLPWHFLPVLMVLAWLFLICVRVLDIR